jgi:hypothetical protein
MTIDKKTCQLLWVYGALERLQGLGLIEGTQMYITQKTIDLYLKIDDCRDKLFDSDEHLTALAKLVCKDFDAEEDSVQHIVDMLFEFRDNRVNLVKHALSS